MSWHDLLFAHYRIAKERLQPLVPKELTLDTFEGDAWLAVVPFRMTHVGPRWLNRLPWVSAFAELNVRTYVRAGGKRGVWFFSLDAANPVAVEVARRGFHLRYLHARMRCLRDSDGWVRYDSVRSDRRGEPAEFAGRYRGVGGVVTARPGSLEEFLTERYCLYAADPEGTIYRADIHHDPWPLRLGELVLDRSTMAEAAGVATPGKPDLLHFVDRLDVVSWGLEPVSD